MKHPNIRTKVKHSESKNAWNVIGDSLAKKYKIARIPYVVTNNDEISTTREKAEALEHAMFISFCFNNPKKINI